MEVHPFFTTAGFKNFLNLTDDQISKRGFLNGGIWTDNTNTIICGTFPPLREYLNPDASIRKGYIHYSSPRNKFWRHVDGIFDTKFYIPSSLARIELIRIENALDKIDWITNVGVGFIDLFTNVKRRKIGGAADSDLIPTKTIFDNDVFERIICSQVQQICFVYSMCYNEFLNLAREHYTVTPKLILPYNTNSIPLEVQQVAVNDKTFLLTYSPIHGNIPDQQKRLALEKVIRFNI